MKKKLVAGLITMLLAFAIGFIVNSGTAYASEDDFVAEYAVIPADKAVPTVTTEEQDEWLFAGWYRSQSCKEDEVLETVTAGEYAWAKYVPADILTVKCQVKDDVQTASSTNLRMVTTVDSLNYKKVGFTVVYNGETPIDVSSYTVYERIEASSESGVEYKYNPKVVDTKSEYFVTATLTDIKSSNYGKVFLIKPYWETWDGTVVYGQSRYVKVSDSYTDVVSLSVKATDMAQANALTINGETIKEVRYSEDGSGWAALVLEEDKAKLPSLTKYTMSDGQEALWRNMETAYAVSGTAATGDQSWYSAISEEDEFVVITNADLYGLAELVNGSNQFAGKTIYLGADIEVNTATLNPDAEDWSTVSANCVQWTPIGGGKTSMDYMPFAGTFDGQGQTIRGLYMKSEGLYLGLFGVLHANGSATVKDLKLTNTYFECSRTTAKSGELDGLGSFVGQGAGNIDTVYTDAILVHGANNTGGIIGNQRHEGTILHVKNAWFDGEITGAMWMGGIVGFVHGTATSTNLADCLVTADITSTLTSGNAVIGGLSGRAIAGEIDSCVAVGTLTGPGFMGGLIGLSATQSTHTWVLSKCYNATNITKQYNPGAKQPALSHVLNVTEAQLEGTQAYSNTWLDFYMEDKNADGKWVAVQSGTPELRSFSTADAKENVSLLNRAVVADTAWYDASKTEFIISTADELYGLAQLCNAGNTFAGMTIKLGADIKVNEGIASEWKNGTNIPVNTWTPIGGGPSSLDYRPFAGTFDGQGHTISGLYMKSEGLYLGLFGVLHADGSATVQNLKLTNSYFECSRTATQSGELDGLGGIAGQGAGTIDTVYTDVILVNKVNNTGGIVGNQRHSGTILSVKNTWFNGEITGAMWMGGILGFMHGTATSTELEDCLVTANITSTLTSGNAVIGGLAGRAIAGTMTSCVAMGTYTGPGFMGGLVGLSATQSTHTWEITNCYNASNITKQYNPGAKQPTLSHVVNLTEEQLKGTNAYTNTLLGFYDANTNATGNWAFVKYNLPELKSFATTNFLEDLSGMSTLSRPTAE